MTQREERITDGSRKRLVLSVLVLLLGAVIAVALTPIFDNQTVHSQDNLKKVEFGFPVAWIQQDQSGIDRTLPWKAKLASVSGSPTSIEPGGLAIDLGAALGLEIVVVGVILLVMQRRNQL